MAVQDEEASAWFFDEEDARDWKPQEEGFDKSVRLCARPNVFSLEADDLGAFLGFPAEPWYHDVVCFHALHDRVDGVIRAVGRWSTCTG